MLLIEQNQKERQSKMPKKKSKNLINKIDTLIISDLYKAGRPLSIKKLAERTGISWPTVKKHVEKLKELGPLKTKKTIRKTRVFIDTEFLKTIMKSAKERGIEVGDIKVRGVRDVQKMNKDDVYNNVYKEESLVFNMKKREADSK